MGRFIVRKHTYELIYCKISKLRSAEFAALKEDIQIKW